MPDKKSRSPDGDAVQTSIVKRPRVDSSDEASASRGKELLSGTHLSSGSLIRTVKRVSDLDAPIMHLTGHEGEVLSCKFSPNGRHLATSSFDRLILLWNAFGAAENYLKLAGHNGAVLQVQWSRDESRIYSASADLTVAVWDTTNGERLRRFKGHTSFVNSCSASRRGPELVASAGDDGLVFYGTHDRNSQPSLSAWDLRNDSVGYTLAGHEDTITVRIWDVKPFTLTPSRLWKTFEGAPHGFEKNLIRPCWSPDSQFIAVGSGDRSVVVWDVASSDIVYKLPGHKGCINDVDWE
ncbi:hypothetical protein BSLG_009592 [Batrachochytrium salamandrivorans]|nr:hypothetical protein BSLG_009592 [Batrachochytrium salamandrivorans]